MIKRKKGNRRRPADRPGQPAARPEGRASVTATSPGHYRTWLPVLQASILIAVSVWIFWPALHGEWLWDDDYLLQQNATIHEAAGLWYIWFQPVQALIDFFPLTVSLEWLLWQISPDNPTVFHVTSLIFHIADCLLLWRLLHKLQLRLAWLGALIFAIHPVLVESVAWMAELKNTVSLFPFLLAMGAWVDFCALKRREDYVLSLLLYVVALLCKSSVITFPVVILLYAWWRNKRVAWIDVLQSLPFFLFSFLDYVGVALVMKHGVGEQFIPLGGPASRVACIGLALAFYFSKCFLPINLLPIYPSWVVNPPTLAEFLPWFVLGGIVWWLWEKRHGWSRHALFGLGFFVITLMPFCGAAKISFMRFGWVMDHMVYMPIIGLIALTVAGLDRISTLLPARRRRWLFGLVVVLCIAMAFSSHEYAKTYQSRVTLWGHEVQENPDAWIAHNNLAGALIDAHRYDEALIQVDLALAINPLYTEAHNNRGTLLARKGRLQEAHDEFKKALSITPDYPAVQNNLDQVDQALRQKAAGKPAPSVSL